MGEEGSICVRLCLCFSVHVCVCVQIVCVKSAFGMYIGTSLRHRTPQSVTRSILPLLVVKPMFHRAVATPSCNTTDVCVMPFHHTPNRHESSSGHAHTQSTSQHLARCRGCYRAKKENRCGRRKGKRTGKWMRPVRAHPCS